MGFAPFVEKYVRRLEVAVQNAALVGGVNGLGDRLHDPRVRVHVGTGPARHGVEAAAGVQLHREVRYRAATRGMPVADLVHRDDVRVVEPRDGLGLAPESLARLGRGGAERLDRDRAVKGRLPRLVDDAHPATAEFTLDLAPGDDRRAGHRGESIL